MSTKLYNGYKIKDLSVRELKEFTDKLRDRLEALFDVEYQCDFAILATNIIDDIVTLDYMGEKSGNMDKVEDYIISTYKNSYNKCWIVNEFLKRESNINLEKALELFSMDYFGWVGSIAHNTIECKNFILNTKNAPSPFDFQNEIAFLPYQDKILFLAYGQKLTFLLDDIISSRKKVDREFKAKYGLEYYGYWNNTDKPDNISYKKWNERGNEWDKVLAPDYVPSKHGICCELISEERFLEDKDLQMKIDATIAPPAKRANKIALGIVRNNWAIAEERKDMSAVELVEEFKKLHEKHVFDSEIISIQEDLEKLLPVIDEKAIKTKLIDFAPNYKKRKGI